jgi:chromosome partitioning protein
MKVITIASGKGGSTKTATLALLAVRAASESLRVAMFDCNADQGNLTQWWIVRGEPMNPRLLDVEKIGRDVDVLRSQSGKSGFDWLFIDTPPLDLDIIETAIVKADAVVIPVRASMLDIGAIDAVVEICKERNKPFSFLLSAVDASMTKLVEKASAELIKDGPIFSTRISYRAPYISAMAAGKVGFEVDKKLRTQADLLWEEVKRLAQSNQPAFKDRAANDR